MTSLADLLRRRADQLPRAVPGSRPWIYIPSLLVAPIFQILLFVYIGRSAGLESDEFYVIGNAVQYAAIPCLFAMTYTIAGERNQQTLGTILVSPASRLPLFLGRALPVVVNGFFVAAFSLVVGGADRRDRHPCVVGRRPLASPSRSARSRARGSGWSAPASGCCIRETAVLSNIVFGVLLIFTGANVPVDALPGWMEASRPCCRSPTGSRRRGEVADGARSRTCRGCWPPRPRRARLRRTRLPLHPARRAPEPALRDPRSELEPVDFRDYDTRLAAYALLFDDEGRVLLALWNEEPQLLWDAARRRRRPPRRPRRQRSARCARRPGTRSSSPGVLVSTPCPPGRRGGRRRTPVQVRAGRLRGTRGRRRAGERGRRHDRRGALDPPLRGGRAPAVPLVDAALALRRAARQ